jgi:hypothetical protein
VGRGQGLRRVPRDHEPLRGGAGKIAALREYTDKYGDSLTADFRQFYGLNIDDAWAGSLDPAHAAVLAEQLKLIPDSRVRAEWLGSIEFMGWGPMQHTLANLYDLVVSVAYSMSGKRAPDKARYPRPAPPVPKPTSIADFNTESFMRQISS